MKIVFDENDKIKEMIFQNYGEYKQYQADVEKKEKQIKEEQKRIERHEKLKKSFTEKGVDYEKHCQLLQERIEDRYVKGLIVSGPPEYKIIMDKLTHKWDDISQYEKYLCLEIRKIKAHMFIPLFCPLEKEELRDYQELLDDISPKPSL